MRKLLDINDRILEKKNEQNEGRGMKIIDRSIDPFFQVPNIFIQEYARVLGPLTSMVYMGMKQHAGSKKDCWPSVRHLAFELSMSGRTVTRGIKDLEAHKVIKVERGHRDYNKYTLVKPKYWKKLSYMKVVGMSKASQSSLEKFRELNRA